MFTAGYYNKKYHPSKKDYAFMLDLLCQSTKEVNITDIFAKVE